ncbi:hypothetical protein AJ79_04834 [Helicocarpus griseus UAMH5409]|uniref:Uncharacterized protein n=1 Tax=Helicocarpus griseus UAMH5409 TaxID=1447875 RepID=A0A2B7XR86_9EURO|nr:hypothetical protein AJ79_04834 [Helicocarpus griseus UAMH5409]
MSLKHRPTNRPNRFHALERNGGWLSTRRTIGPNRPNQLCALERVMVADYQLTARPNKRPTDRTNRRHTD